MIYFDWRMVRNTTWYNWGDCRSDNYTNTLKKNLLYSRIHEIEIKESLIRTWFFISFSWFKLGSLAYHSVQQTISKQIISDCVSFILPFNSKLSTLYIFKSGSFQVSNFHFETISIPYLSENFKVKIKLLLKNYIYIFKKQLLNR